MSTSRFVCLFVCFFLFGVVLLVFVCCCFLFTSTTTWPPPLPDPTTTLFQITILVVIYISTGGCSGNRIHPAFRELAEFTSGQSLLLKDAAEVERLKNVILKALEGTTIISLGSTLLKRRKRSSGEQHRYRFPVDDSMETITISVKTTQRDTKGL